MILGRKHGYIFIQSPHTGCTAVAKHLIAHYGGEEILWKHAMFHHLKRLPEIDPSKHFVFSTVRNPFDEIVSVYHKFKNDHEEYSNPVNWSKNGGWLSNRGLRQFQMVHDDGASFGEYVARFYRMPYVNWSILDHKKFDAVMRFETLHDDFASVLNQLNLDSGPSIEKVNPTKKRFLPEIESDDRLRHRVVFAFSPLMRFWGYQFPEDSGLTVENKFYNNLLFKINCVIRSKYWRMKK